MLKYAITLQFIHECKRDKDGEKRETYTEKLRKRQSERHRERQREINTDSDRKRLNDKSIIEHISN